MSYVVHCTVKKFDKGLDAPTIARPTYYIDETDKATAIESTKDKIYTDYSDPLVNITSIEIDLVRKIGG